MPNATTPDYVAAWDAYIEKQTQAARTDKADSQVWESFAKRCETIVPPSREILGVLLPLVKPTDTVLDVGAGTGRFAFPLAAVAQRVTALDRSAAMLDIIRHKLTEQQIENIDLVAHSWETAAVVPHDVVLAAWSLYRQQDILEALRKLVKNTLRTLVIIAGDDSQDCAPHTPLREAIWGKGYVTPNYLCLVGLLREIGIRADVRVVYEQRAYACPSPLEIAAQIAPLKVTEDELERFTKDLLPLLAHNEEGYHYAFSLPVGIVIWQRRNA